MFCQVLVLSEETQLISYSKEACRGISHLIVAGSVPEARPYLSATLDVAIVDDAVTASDPAFVQEMLEQCPRMVPILLAELIPQVLHMDSFRRNRLVRTISRPFSQGEVLAAIREVLHFTTLRYLGLVAAPLPSSATNTECQPNARDKAYPTSDLNELSQRELEIYNLCLSRRNPRQIAQRLSISIFTVRNHLQSIYRKLGVHTRSELHGTLPVRAI